MTVHDLDGVRILVVEDDVLAALDLADTLTANGASVTALCHTLGTALVAARTIDVDLGLLDIDLAGEAVFPAARVLRGRGIPFMFQTGHSDRDILRTEFAGAPVCTKPIQTRQLLRELKALLRIVA